MGLGGVAVTNKGVEHLVVHGDRLKTLSLQSTKVTDAGLKTLDPVFPEYGWLWVGDTAITREAVDAFKAKRPKLSIHPFYAFGRYVDPMDPFGGPPLPPPAK